MKRGKIIRKAKKDTWLVDTGNLKITLKSSQLKAAGSSEKNTEGFSVQTEGGGAPDLTLDLRGERLNQALFRLEKQVDNAIISGLREFHIIHGKGEGILRTGIHNWLKESPHVQDFYFAPPETGGFGKTIVIL